MGRINVSMVKKPNFFYGYVIIAACFVMMTVFWGTYYTFGVFFNSLVNQFGWSREVTSSAIAANGILLGIFFIPVARWSDKYGPQIIIGVCGVVLGSGYFLMSRVNAGWQLYVYFVILVAIGMGAYIAMLALIARWFVKRRALMTAVVFCGMGVGMMLIPPLISQLIVDQGWRFSYMIVGIISLVGITGGAQFLRSDPQKMGQVPYGKSEFEPNDTARATGVSFREALRTRQFWQVSTMYFIFLTCELAITVHIVIYATGTLAVPEVSAATIFSFLGFSLIAGMLVMGAVANRFSNKIAFILSFALLVVSFVWLLAAKELWMLRLFGVLAGFSWGGMQILYAPITAELFGLVSHSVILAGAAFVGGIGAAVGPWMAGKIYDITDSYSLAFIICATLAAIGLVMAILLIPIHRTGRGIEWEQPPRAPG
jgi:OFA family oxalate/formate antiporter-like MFS transporter